MKKNTLILLGGVAAASAVAVVVKMRSNAATFSAKSAEIGQMLLKDVPYENVEGFKITDAKHEVEITKKDGKWVIPSRDNWPASVPAVNEITDSGLNLKVSRVEKGVGGSQYGRLGLAPKEKDTKPEDTGRTVVFKDSSGKELGGVTVGKNIDVKGGNPNAFDMSGPAPTEQWIKVLGQEVIYAVSTGFARLEADPKGWLDKENFFKIEKPKSVAVAGPTPEDSWKIFREADAGEVKLDGKKDGEEFDTGKATPSAGAFAFPAFEDVLPAAEKDKAALDKPTHTATVETFDGVTYTVKVGAKAPAPEGDTTERYYVSFSIDGKLDETIPPYAAPEPKAPVALPELPADATEETKKKYEEDKKRYDADKAKFDTDLKTWTDGKKTHEDSFKTTLKTKQERVAQEQGLKDRIFVVQKHVLDPILKKRADLMKTKEAPPAPDGGTPPVSISPVTNPPPAPGGRIEATTPPIEVTMPDKDGKDEAKKDEAKKDEAKKDEAKKDEAVKDEAKKDEK